MIFSKLGLFYGLRFMGSDKIMVQQSLLKTVINTIKRTNSNNPSKGSAHCGSFRGFSSVGTLFGGPKRYNLPHNSQGRRSYHVYNIIPQACNQLHRFIAKTRSSFSGQIKQPRFGLLEICVVSTVIFCGIEKVPYSNKSHLVISSDKPERWLGTGEWEEFLLENRAAILPANDPRTVRVQSILRKIVQGMNDGLRLEHDCRVFAGYLSRHDRKLLSEKGNIKGGLLVQNHGESKKSAKKFRLLKYGTKHLDGLNWEVVVVNSKEDNAGHYPNGKIVVYTKLLDDLDNDELVAAVLAHEVGHAVARHTTNTMVFMALFFILLWNLEVSDGERANAMKLIVKIRDFIQLFFSRRWELEADHIGMMIMASAGYDPQYAPQLHELPGMYSKRTWQILFSTHPSGETRAKLLRRKEVMKEAMAIYQQVRDGQEVKSAV